jgi:hypothetical protein
MNLETILNASESEILDEALATLQAMHVTHYESAGDMFTRQRLDDLYRLVVTAIHDRDVSAVTAYAEAIAEERFHAGFDITEVQTAFNTLETATWRRVVAGEPAVDLAESIGLLSTVFGVAKDALARTYVSLATRHHVTSLDLSAMFDGTTS